jgi:hypothetical protein
MDLKMASTNQRLPSESLLTLDRLPGVSFGALRNVSIDGKRNHSFRSLAIDQSYLIDSELPRFEDPKSSNMRFSNQEIDLLFGFPNEMRRKSWKQPIEHGEWEKKATGGTILVDGPCSALGTHAKTFPERPLRPT